LLKKFEEKSVKEKVVESKSSFGFRDFVDLVESEKGVVFLTRKQFKSLVFSAPEFVVAGLDLNRAFRKQGFTILGKPVQLTD